MSYPFSRRVDWAIAWIFRIAAISIWGYAVWSVFAGEIRMVSRFTDAVISLERTPLPFLAAVGIFVFGGAMFLWIAHAITKR